MKDLSRVENKSSYVIGLINYGLLFQLDVGQALIA